MPTNPNDPAAYRLHDHRVPDAAGRLVSISLIERDVETGGDADTVATWTDGNDLDHLIALARDEERSDPHSDKLPSDRAFILAALRDLGIPIQEEEDDGAESEARIQNAMAFGLEPPEEAPHLDPQDEPEQDDECAGDPDWRDVPVLVQVEGAEDRLVLAGAFADANAEEPGLEPTLRELVRGDVDWCRFGGGAAPMVQVVRAFETPGFDFEVLAALHRTMAKADACDALLEAARDAEAFMSGFEDDDLQDPPINARLDALRAAIAAAEGGR
jgi:hypothetical protein